MGPATKILPTLNLFKDEADKLIIVLDDDQIYPKGMVENYVKNSKDLPDAAMTPRLRAVEVWRTRHEFQRFAAPAEMPPTS